VDVGASRLASDGQVFKQEWGPRHSGAGDALWLTTG